MNPASFVVPVNGEAFTRNECIAFRELPIVLYHFLHKFRKTDFRLPAEFLLRLAGIA
jgi:hypothetical protein